MEDREERIGPLVWVSPHRGEWERMHGHRVRVWREEVHKIKRLQYITDLEPVTAVVARVQGDSLKHCQIC